jgi:hypothetical protein
MSYFPAYLKYILYRHTNGLTSLYCGNYQVNGDLFNNYFFIVTQSNMQLLNQVNIKIREREPYNVPL